MKKDLLKSREDFIELKNYYENEVYDAVGFVAEVKMSQMNILV